MIRILSQKFDCLSIGFSNNIPLEYLSIELKMTNMAIEVDVFLCVNKKFNIIQPL